MSAVLPAGGARYRSGRRSGRNAWEVTTEDPDRKNQTRPLDFLAFASFAFGVAELPGGLPLNEVLPMAVCGLALTRRATSNRRTPWWFTTLLLSLLGFLALTSYLHDLTPVRRLVHVVTYVTLASFLANGRIHVPSAVRGLAVGLTLSIPLAIAGVGPESYANRLTGFLGDPNGAGYIITTLGVLALGLLTDQRFRLLLLVLLPLAVVLTFSRTTLLAAAFTVTWLIVGQRVSRTIGLLLVAGMVYIVGHIPAHLKAAGPFSDRTGSDQLRQRIEALEQAQVHQSPLIGSGAGTARVELGPDTFFYHSSYLALQREGGLVCVVLLISLVGFAFLRATGQPRRQRNGWVEASLICFMVCAVNLGEVLLELPGAVALGVLMWHTLNPSPIEAAGPEPAPAEPSVPARRRSRHASPGPWDAP